MSCGWENWSMRRWSEFAYWMIISLLDLPHISQPTSWTQSPITWHTAQRDAKPKQKGILWCSISFLLFPRPLACTKGQRNTCLSDSPGVCSPLGTRWMRWTKTPPKYWPNSMSQPWLGWGKMNALLDDCRHWKSAALLSAGTRDLVRVTWWCELWVTSS